MDKVEQYGDDAARGEVNLEALIGVRAQGIYGDVAGDTYTSAMWYTLLTPLRSKGLTLSQSVKLIITLRMVSPEITVSE